MYFYKTYKVIILFHLYRVGGCEKDCSGNGQCMNQTCSCFTGYGGEFCQTEICPNNCSTNGVCAGTQCNCYHSYTGMLFHVHVHKRKFF